MEHDNPIAKYYEKLAMVQSRGAQASHQVCTVFRLKTYGLGIYTGKTYHTGSSEDLDNLTATPEI